MKNAKMLAVLFAAVLAVAAVPVFGMAMDSSAESTEEIPTAGEFNVYMANSIFCWNVDAGISAYNAYEAITASKFMKSTDVIDGEYTVWRENDWGGFYDINENYGKVTTFNGKSDMKVYVYTDADQNGSFEWVSAIDALGFYKPFADYMPKYATANIAFYNGILCDTAVIASLSLATFIGCGMSTADLTEIDRSEGSAFEVSFLIGAVSGVPTIIGDKFTAEELEAGVEVKGYGSDVFLAMIDAVGAENVTGGYATGDYDYLPGYTGYGWTGTIFGLGTDFVDGNYVWWQIFDDAGYYADFVLGAYSSVGGSPMCMNEFGLVY